MKEREEARLPEAADAMLQQWPAPERKDADWEASAEAIVRRLKDGEVDPVSDELLAPPLPAEPGEGRMPRRSEADGSLAEMARARLRRGARPEDAAAIAKESLTLMKEEDRIGARANTVAAAAGSAIAEPAIAEPDEEAEVVNLDAARAEEARHQESEAPAKTTDTGAGRLAAAALVAVGIAAGIALYVQSVSHGGSSKPTAVVLGPAADRAPERPRREQTEPRAGTEEKSVDVGDLPTGETSDESPRGRARTRVAKRPAAAPDQKEAVIEEPATSGAESPGESEDEDEGLRPALDEAVPLEPSTGAVSSALGGSLGAARRCVIGHDKASTATVVFSSNGRVKSVLVTGPSAGTPAEACIKNAFRAMRLPRFGKPTFTIRGITIRP